MQQPPIYQNKIYSKLILGAIILFYLINGICYLQKQSITSDEGSFMHYAIRFLKGNPERVAPVTDNSKMPVSVLNTIPRIVNDAMRKEPPSDGGIKDTMQGRYITLFMSVFTILLVYVWSRQLYGEAAGLFSAFLAALCPNSLAHAGLVTTDSYSAFFLLSSMYWLWKFCRIRTNRYFLLFAISVALSQLVKQSLFHLYILAPLCLMIYSIAFPEKFNGKIFLRRFLIFAAASLVIINLGYYFSGSFRALADFNFLSQLFQNVQQVLPGGLRLPFPKPFIDGLDMAKYYDQVGGGIEGTSSFGKPTILGEARTGGSFWYYYFVSIFYKTPVSYLLFFIGAGYVVFRTRAYRSFIANEFFLIAPTVYFLILMSFFYNTQCGLRHIIFIYPFLFILSGILIKYLRSRATRIIIGILLLLLVISVVRYWGNYYPYTNEIVSNKKMAYSKLGSANLEFHQGYYFAERFLSKHPDVRWAPLQPQQGRFIINVEDYEDIWNRHSYDWIKKIKPYGHVAYNYLLIEVKPTDLAPK